MFGLRYMDGWLAPPSLIRIVNWLGPCGPGPRLYTKLDSKPKCIIFFLL